jgi:hypothetical protein
MASSRPLREGPPTETSEDGAIDVLSQNAGSATRAWDEYQAFAHSGPDSGAGDRIGASPLNRTGVKTPVRRESEF